MTTHPALLTAPHPARVTRLDAYRDALVEHDSERVEWHLQRLSGFGGSEIGVAVSEYLGGRDDFACMREIIDQKRMLRLPDAPTPQMQRGVEMEPLVLAKFKAKFRAQTDEQAVKVLSQAVGPRPWMRYSPDDVVLIDGKRYLVDAKAPGTPSDVMFRYACQLHQGRMVCEHAGVKIDGMFLTQFDWNKWCTRDDEVLHDPEIDSLILKAGDHFWSYVERDVSPEYPAAEKARKLEEDDEQRGEIMAMMRTFVTSKLLMEQAKIHNEAARGRLQDIFKGRREDGRLDLSALTLGFKYDLVRERVEAALGESARQCYRLNPDIALMEKALVETGIPREKWCQEEFDMDLAARHIEEKGIDRMAIGEQTIRFTLPRKSEVLDELKQAAHITIGRMMVDAESLLADKAEGEAQRG